MKKLARDVLLGILVCVFITIFEFLVTLPFGAPDADFGSRKYSTFINRELLLTALPAALTTFLLAWWLKTRSESDALREGAIWTAVVALSFVLIGLGNDNFAAIFRTIGIYALLTCTFAGPVLYAKRQRLPRTAGNSQNPGTDPKLLS